VLSSRPVGRRGCAPCRRSLSGTANLWNETVATLATGQTAPAWLGLTRRLGILTQMLIATGRFTVGGEAGGHPTGGPVTFAPPCEKRDRWLVAHAEFLVGLMDSPVEVNGTDCASPFDTMVHGPSTASNPGACDQGARRTLRWTHGSLVCPCAEDFGTKTCHMDQSCRTARHSRSRSPSQGLSISPYKELGWQPATGPRLFTGGAKVTGPPWGCPPASPQP